MVPLLAGRDPARDLSPQPPRRQTLGILKAWLLAKAERQPTLGLWEDLHWADFTTLELLGLLVEQAPTALAGGRTAGLVEALTPLDVVSMIGPRLAPGCVLGSTGRGAVLPATDVPWSGCRATRKPGWRPQHGDQFLLTLLGGMHKEART